MRKVRHRKHRKAVVHYTGRNKTAGLDEVPGWVLRPGAPKMQLRPDEEEQLSLVY